MKFSALVLAAGSGQRFGGAKLQALLGKKRLIDHALNAARASGAADILLVTAPGTALDTSPGVRLVTAFDAANGMGASLAAGVAALDANCDGVLVFLGDMPFVPHDTGARLVAALGNADAAVPVWQGRRGHPALLARSLFANVSKLSRDTGARAILGKARVVEIPAPDDGVLFDIDTPEALEAARIRLSRQPPALQ